VDYWQRYLEIAEVKEQIQILFLSLLPLQPGKPLAVAEAVAVYSKL
jgi:hypothetical protein